MTTVSELHKYTKNLERTLQTLSGKNSSAADKLALVQGFNESPSLGLALAATETYSYSGPSMGPGNSSRSTTNNEGEDPFIMENKC